MPSYTTITRCCDGCWNSFTGEDADAAGTYCDGCDVWRCAECGPCAGRCCTTCGGEGFHHYDGYSCGQCGEWNCENCGDCCRESYGHDAVYSYGYKPCFVTHGAPVEGEPTLGIELEVGGDDYMIVEAVHSVDPDEDLLYMTEDSSISGVEITSHPMTLAYARKYPFTQLLNDMSGSGCYVDDGYGLHIHVGRDAFNHGGKRSSLHQMRWLLFMTRNARHMEKLARRVSHWGAFRTPRPGELVQKAKGERVGDRGAVNCQNSATFELRFFKSTLDPQEFYAALELADATIRYTRGLSTQDVLHGRGLSFQRFARWVARHNYKHLSAQITKLCPPSAERPGTRRVSR